MYENVKNTLRTTRKTTEMCVFLPRICHGVRHYFLFALKVALGEPCSGPVDHLLKRVHMLKHYGVKPWVVLDGRRTPMKVLRGRTHQLCSAYSIIRRITEHLWIHSTRQAVFLFRRQSFPCITGGHQQATPPGKGEKSGHRHRPQAAGGSRFRRRERRPTPKGANFLPKGEIVINVCMAWCGVHLCFRPAGNGQRMY